MIKSNLDKLLDKNNLNNKQIAKLVKARENTISDIKKNKIKEYPVETLDKLCEILECDIGDILYYEPDKIESEDNVDYDVSDNKMNK